MEKKKNEIIGFRNKYSQKFEQLIKDHQQMSGEKNPISVRMGLFKGGKDEKGALLDAFVTVEFVDSNIHIVYKDVESLGGIVTEKQALRKTHAMWLRFTETAKLMLLNNLYALGASMELRSKSENEEKENNGSEPAIITD